jgi:hypothetical protein
LALAATSRNRAEPGDVTAQNAPARASGWEANLLLESFKPFRTVEAERKGSKMGID